MAEQQPPRRSTLPKDEAQRRYIEIGELVVLEQIKRDADWLDDHPIAIGPFARLDASAAAAHDGKTRGVISNLFGSQAAFQAETMALALSAADWIDRIQYPDPAAFPDAEAWLDALLAAESARGPRHAADPVIDFGTLWALWLGAVPYGLWSDKVVGPSMDEHVQVVGRLAQVLAGAIDHFGLELRDDTTVDDLAFAHRRHGRGRLAQPVPHDASTRATRRSRSRPCSGGRAACSGAARFRPRRGAPARPRRPARPPARGRAGRACRGCGRRA